MRDFGDRVIASYKWQVGMKSILPKDPRVYKKLVMSELKIKDEAELVFSFIDKTIRNKKDASNLRSFGKKEIRSKVFNTFDLESHGATNSELLLKSEISDKVEIRPEISESFERGIQTEDLGKTTNYLAGMNPFVEAKTILKLKKKLQRRLNGTPGFNVDDTTRSLKSIIKHSITKRSY